MKLTPNEQYEIFEKEFKNNRAFSVDWDSSAEDVAYNIKNTIPELDIDAVPAKQVLGDWIEIVTIEGKKYNFDLELETKPVEIVSLANKYLKKTKKVFVFFDSKDDQYCFILINQPELQEYLGMGFIKI